MRYVQYVLQWADLSPDMLEAEEGFEITEEEYYDFLWGAEEAPEMSGWIYDRPDNSTIYRTKDDEGGDVYHAIQSLPEPDPQYAGLWLDDIAKIEA